MSSARRYHRNACWALAWAVVVFAGVQALLSRLMWHECPHWRDPFFYTKLTRLQERQRHATPDTLTIVMLGSSRVVWGFQSPLLEEELTKALRRPVVAFNLGVFGAGPVLQRIYLQRLLACGIRPDLVLVEVFPEQLHVHDGEHELARLPPQLLEEGDLPLMGRFGAGRYPHLARDWWQARMYPVYAQRRQLLKRLWPGSFPPASCLDWLPDNPHGWLGLPADVPVRRTPRDEPHMCLALADLQVAGIAPWALEDLLACAARAGCATMLVHMPEGSMMRDIYAEHSRTLANDYLEGICRRHRCAAFVSATDWVGDEGFHDAIHMFPSGADVFTRRLGREVLVPYFLGTRPRADVFNVALHR